ncbi:hypothetical protein [Agromyces sp. H66]|nr:hypothetical protein [Agromyces sp. H66]
MGTSFVVAAYLQVVRGYNAIETGLGLALLLPKEQTERAGSSAT